MTGLQRLFIGLGLAMASWHASAESLRCNGHMASVGDSRLSVLFKCGEPLLKDAQCAPVFTLAVVPPGTSPAWVQVPHTLAPCQQVEEWLYDRGPGNMMATVRFRSGLVQDIRYSRSPQ